MYGKAESLLYGVETLKASLQNYEMKLKKAIRRSGPSDIAPIDLSKPKVQGQHPRPGITESSDEIAKLTAKIQEIRDELGDITRVLAQLEPIERRIIELWYFKRITKAKIIEELHYASANSIYPIRDRALKRFTDLFPW